MLPKQFIFGGFITLFFAAGCWLQYLHKYPKPQEVVEKNIDNITAIKLMEKSIELKHCERKLLLQDRKDIGRKAALQVLTPWLAPIVWDGTYDSRILHEQFKGKQIGLFVFAVKKYIVFLLPFLESAERHFMVGHMVKYYVFTDKVEDVKKPTLGKDRVLSVRKGDADKRWQDVSMRRMEVLSKLTQDPDLQDIDYLVCADVDMVFNDHVGVEMLGDLVATVHPALFLVEPENFPYERRPISAAAIPKGEGDFYYMAAFYGGKVQEIHKLTTACQKGIISDKEKNIEAAWQEESHLNKYLVDHKPTKVLSPEYIWDNNLPNGDLVKRRRFLAVPKNHQEIRN
ncbi:histo-blood group ABO system transferase [Bombina bombina]|uniref:histo-blood group ABO system transferase n=1 Tax=Bombina bombina TaxID=8345 RepID=UPI00235AAB2B|nr:histo-blood group ABO system transferase [Bombina bombina]